MPTSVWLTGGSREEGNTSPIYSLNNILIPYQPPMGRSKPGISAENGLGPQGSGFKVQGMGSGSRVQG